MDNIAIINDKFNMYYGDYVFLIMVIIGSVYLMIEDKEVKRKLLYPLFIIIFCITCPILYEYAFKNIIYWRLFWVIPDTMIISVVLVKLIKKAKFKITKSLILVFATGIIVFMGTNVFHNAIYSSVQNGYKISQDTVDVCNIILESDEEPKCIIPRSIYSEVRQYSGEIQVMYGRNAQGYINAASVIDEVIYEKMESKKPKYETVLAFARYEGYNFIVTNIDKPIDSNLLNEYMFIEIGRTEKYIVYHSDAGFQNGWLVTQMGNNSKWENSTYILENKDNDLIIIDGGREGNYETLLEVLERHNYHVDAWILSTPRREHIGAFNKIVRDVDNIKIDTIYALDVNYDRYKKTAKDYDYFEYYDEFVELTSDMDNVIYVQPGDKIDLLGLEYEIINAWDSNTDGYNWGLTNIGAMVFSLSYKNESILFCSDVSKKTESKIIEHIESKDFDYIQISNHGSNGLSYDFYDRFNPKAVFIDASIDKIENKSKIENCDLVSELFLKKGANIYTLDSSPNMFILD